MKKYIFALSFAFVTIGANAQFLFRISGNTLKEPSYILGSVHTLPGSLLDSIPEYLEAEAACRQLYAEYESATSRKSTRSRLQDSRLSHCLRAKPSSTS